MAHNLYDIWKKKYDRKTRNALYIIDVKGIV